MYGTNKKTLLFSRPVSILFLLALGLPSGPARGEERGLWPPDAWSLLVGRATASLEVDPDYEAWFLSGEGVWNVTEAVGVSRWSERIRVELVAEPYGGVIAAPRENLAVGLNGHVKVTMELEEDYSPYVRLGVGVEHMTLHVEEQSTQWNIASQAGVGLEIPLRQGVEMHVEYRIRHISNGGMEHPNSGVDSGAVWVGLRFTKAGLSHPAEPDPSPWRR